MTNYVIYGSGMLGLYIAREIATRCDHEKDKVRLIGKPEADIILKHTLISDKAIEYHQSPNLSAWFPCDALVWCADDDIGSAKTVQELARQCIDELDSVLIQIPEKWHGRICLVSSDTVYGSKENVSFTEGMPYAEPEERDPYDIAKITQEKMVLHSENYVILRPSIVYGAGIDNTPLHEMCYKALSGETIEVGPGKRDYIHVTDFCAAVWAALSEKDAAEIINVGSGEPIENVVLARTINVLANSQQDLHSPRSQVILSRKEKDKFITLNLTKMGKLLKVGPPRHLQRGISSELARIINDLPLDSHTAEELRLAVGGNAMDDVRE